MNYYSVKYYEEITYDGYDSNSYDVVREYFIQAPNKVLVETWCRHNPHLEEKSEGDREYPSWRSYRYYYVIREYDYNFLKKSKWKWIICLTEKVVENVVRDVEKNKKSKEDDKKTIEKYEKVISSEKEKIKAIKRKWVDEDKALAKKCKF